jgi:hypothetical protein
MVKIIVAKELNSISLLQKVLLLLVLTQAAGYKKKEQ